MFVGLAIAKHLASDRSNGSLTAALPHQSTSSPLSSLTGRPRMSTTNTKLQKERNQKALLELAALSGNNVCADCKARLPRWASSNLGIFICVNCASIHRKIGTHITKVKSLTMDDWTKDQVEHMRSMGNIRSNAIYNPNELKHPPPPNLEDSERDSEIEQYIRAKYEYRKFIDRSALVASKLGPSRSASMMTPRSVSSPTTQIPPSSSSPVVTATDVAASSPIAPNPPKQPIQPRPPPPCPMPQHQTRSVSQSPSVWDDINSLAHAGQNSSLPLQYASQPATVLPAGAIGANGYPVGVTSLGMGMNPFQPQQMSMGTNPFSQQQSQSPFAPASPFSAPPNMASSFSQPQSTSFGQQYFSGGSGQPTTPIMTQPTSTPSFFQPQASSMQVPTTQSFLTPSPSQQFMSAPPSQSNFLTPSPSQQFSGSPQPQMQMQQLQTANQPQFMSQTPMSTQPPFLGMTTMQMQQQQHLMQQQQQQHQQQQFLQQQQLQQQQQQQMQQQQQQQQQFGQNMYAPPQPQMTAGQNGMYGQMFPQGGFPTQVGGQQWGAM